MTRFEFVFAVVLVALCIIIVVGFFVERSTSNTVEIEHPNNVTNLPVCSAFPVVVNGEFKFYFVTFNGHRYFVFPNATVLDIDSPPPHNNQ